MLAINLAYTMVLPLIVAAFVFGTKTNAGAGAVGSIIMACAVGAWIAWVSAGLLLTVWMI